MQASTRLETPNGSKYLQQLCKHFGHKVEVEYDEKTGRAALPPGPAVLEADAAGLTITVEAEDIKGLTQARYIIEDHLIRFAWKEKLMVLIWAAETPGGLLPGESPDDFAET